MKVPLVYEILSVSEHFGLCFYPLLERGYILGGEYVIDNKEVIIDLCDKFIIIAQYEVLAVFIGNHDDLCGLPNGLYLRDHLE